MRGVAVKGRIECAQCPSREVGVNVYVPVGLKRRGAVTCACRSLRVAMFQFGACGVFTEIMRRVKAFLPGGSSSSFSLRRCETAVPVPMVSG